jgi:hypothetical protein
MKSFVLLVLAPFVALQADPKVVSALAEGDGSKMRLKPQPLFLAAASTGRMSRGLCRSRWCLSTLKTK